MGLRPCLFALFIMVGACGVDSSPPDESAVDQQLTASEIDSSWFTDAAFTNQVGESDLQYQQPSCTGCSGSYTVVACPAGLF